MMLMLMLMLAVTDAATDTRRVYAVCRLLRDGVAAVFGPTVAETSRHVQAVCEAVEMPHFRAHWDLDSAVVDDDDDDDDDDEVDGEAAEVDAAVEGGLYSVSVHPPYSTVSRSLVDFVRAHDWKSFAVLYDSDDGTSPLSGSAQRPKATVTKRQ